MKRLLLLLCILFPAILNADNVTVERATSLAQKFFTQHATTRASEAPQLTLVWDGETALTRDASTKPAYYVFNRTNGGGFVIVSGEDSTLPVLGYSLEHPFCAENMPSNLEAWMAHLRTSINNMRAEGELPSQEVRQAWASLPSYTATGDALLLETALWDQGDPYNLKCPKIDGKLTVTGCVATAFAIVMRYHQWPEKATKTIPTYSYTLSDGEITQSVAYQRPTTYDWSNMPLTVDVATSDEAKNQIATLMRHCGQMAEAAYGVSETGAVTHTAASGLLTYMDYDKGLRYLDRDHYTEAQWIAMLKEEIKNVGPVIYGGVTLKSEGHQFVLDGYNGDDYFHLNWGWGGNANGYYLISNLSPTSQGIGGSSGGGFTQYQDALFGVKKSVEGQDYVPNLCLIPYSFSNGESYKGVEVDVATLVPNEPFTAKAGAIHNMGFSTFNGFTILALLDKDYNVKQQLGTGYTFAGETNGLKPMYLAGLPFDDCKITSTIVEGDKIALLYSTKPEEEGYGWMIPLGDPNEVTVEVVIGPGNTTAITAVEEKESGLSVQQTGDMLTVQADSDLQQINLFDVNGRLIRLYPELDGTTQTVSVAQCPAGIYIIKVKTANGIKTGKFVKK